MTNRERLLAVISHQPTDRVPFRVWGFDHRRTFQEPTYQALAEIIRPFRPDLFIDWGPHVHGGKQYEATVETRHCPHEGFVEDVTTIQTPAGSLTSGHLRSLEGKPGYHSKYLIETPEDAERWLAIPWTPTVVDASGWQEADRALGDDGILIIGIAEPMYEINDLMGSERWAYWLVEERDLLHRLVADAYERHVHTLKETLAAGVTGLFGYCGPELCIPPLASPRDFDDFVVRYDKPMHDLVHDAGGHIWVHCHGRMGPVLERFADEGVDILNPMEPPPMGDLTIAEARQRVGDRMALEGGIEVGDLDLKTPAEIEQLTADCIQQSGGIGYIASFSSDLSHWPTLSPRIIENVRVFLETAGRVGEAVCR